MTMTGRILPDLKAEATVTLASIQAEIAQLRAENVALRASKHKSLSFKVTEKGGLSVYGLGRFPVTLYRGQWERLIEAQPQIVAFIQANSATLSVKE